MITDIQINPATTSWPALRDGVLTAEHLGYGAAWVFDHLDGRVLSRGQVVGSGMLECFSLLGALAATTTTIGLGSLVVNVHNRPAGTLAASAATVQRISDGRLLLGLGAGAAPGSRWASEQDALGIELKATMAERHAVLSHQLDVLDLLWTADRHETYAGFELPALRPPVLLGVNSVALARIAGERCDGVNVRATHPRGGELIEIAREAAGSRPFVTTAWAAFDDRTAIDTARSWDVDRLILVWFVPLDPQRIPSPNG